MSEKSPSPHDIALLTAARRGDVAAAREALAAGADPEARDAVGRTPVLRAALAGHVAVAELLVAAGADVNAQDSREDSAWLVTGVTGSVPMMRALLPGGPDVTLTNRFGGVSVIPAAERAHVPYVRAVLAETDMDVDHVNRLGWTALLEAVLLGDGTRPYQEVVEALLAAGADPLLPDGDGVTARTHAERLGFREMADMLRRAEERVAGVGGKDGQR
ncbi:ankyrin repeat domain-containing protein [Streptomyces sp. TRM S81-3]|uniref:Ankyrin repeat domain-containing protein n=1 Tax=Streptomyces griseicoloratus TaxID=2752516 RepID=A0A926L4V5_9ACTN|nr:ankyrin repeat domain-containing protein [Streptomyces griseicoloratus]MBD0421469.1 ankyrin repeat domain-containing protein [Streptomyces griseicoloratus]